MKFVGGIGFAILLLAAAGAAQAQSVQIGPQGVQVTPYGGYGQSGPGPCQGLQHKAHIIQERLAGSVNPGERARLQGRLAEIRQQQARCGR